MTSFFTQPGRYNSTRIVRCLELTEEEDAKEKETEKLSEFENGICCYTATVDVFSSQQTKTFTPPEVNDQGSKITSIRTANVIVRVKLPKLEVPRRTSVRQARTLGFIRQRNPSEWDILRYRQVHLLNERTFGMGATKETAYHPLTPLRLTTVH